MSSSPSLSKARSQGLEALPGVLPQRQEEVVVVEAEDADAPLGAQQGHFPCDAPLASQPQDPAQARPVPGRDAAEGAVVVTAPRADQGRERDPEVGELPAFAHRKGQGVDRVGLAARRVRHDGRAFPVREPLDPGRPQSLVQRHGEGLDRLLAIVADDGIDGRAVLEDALVEDGRKMPPARDVAGISLLAQQRGELHEVEGPVLERDRQAYQLRRMLHDAAGDRVDFLVVVERQEVGRDSRLAQRGREVSQREVLFVLGADQGRLHPGILTRIVHESTCSVPPARSIRRLQLRHVQGDGRAGGGRGRLDARRALEDDERLTARSIPSSGTIHCEPPPPRASRVSARRGASGGTGSGCRSRSPGA